MGFYRQFYCLILSTSKQDMFFLFFHCTLILRHLFLIIEIENVILQQMYLYLCIAFCSTELYTAGNLHSVLQRYSICLTNCIHVLFFISFLNIIDTKGPNLHGMPTYFMALLAEYQADLCQRVHGFSDTCLVKPRKGPRVVINFLTQYYIN